MYFDIGANVGLWALANIDKCEKIVAVEASPITFGKLTQECKHDHIVLLNFAACNNDGKDITFYHSNADTISTINKEWLTHPKSRFCNYTGFVTMTCKTITLDKLIETYGVPELIKIDVEGGEYECVASLSRKVKCLCFEWSSELNDVSYKCLNHLATLGFTRFYLQFGDEYIFRPETDYFRSIDDVKAQLSRTIPKRDMGMLWCE